MVIRDIDTMIRQARYEYAYWRSATDYKERFIYEIVELEDRIDRLSSILSNYPKSSKRDILEIQLEIMKSYHTVLRIRLNNGHL